MVNKWLLTVLLFSPFSLVAEGDLPVCKSSSKRGDFSATLRHPDKKFCIVESKESKEVHHSSKLRGRRGARGARGPFGHDGQRGPRGHMGNRGLRGYRGHRGCHGKHGANGANGANGAVGQRGATGATGPGPGFAEVDGQLFFTFTANNDPSPSASGRWQFFIIAPDSTIMASQTINITDPTTQYTLTVASPILLSDYTAVGYNRDLQNVSIGDLIDTSNFVTVTTSFNNINDEIFQNFMMDTTLPGSTTEAQFVPFVVPPAL